MRESLHAWSGVVIAGVIASCAGDSNAEAARFTIVRELDPPPGGSFWAPIDLVATHDHLWVLDVGADQVYVYAPDGTYRTTVGKPGPGPGELEEPLALGVAGDTLWVLNTGNRRIEYYGASGDSLGFALGSEPLPDSLPSPLDLARLGADWYATTPFLPEPMVRFQTGGGSWMQFGAEVAEVAAELTPRGATIPDAYRIEVEGSRLWVFHLYLPVMAIYDGDGKLDRIVIYPGEEVRAHEQIEEEKRAGRVRRLIRAPRSPAGGLGLLRMEQDRYILTRQRGDGRQKLYRLELDRRRGGTGVAGRVTLMPHQVLFLTSIQSHGRTYAVGTKGGYEEPSVFMLQ